MANKRMFSRELVNTDAFSVLSLSAQALYFRLCLEADDDGFLSSTLRITRSIGGTETELKELLDSGFLIRFDSGIYLIRHWNIHNTLQNDRHTKTMHENELNCVMLISKTYYLLTEAECIQSVSKTETQDSKDKNSKEIDKDSEVESSRDESPPSLIIPPINELRDYANSIGYHNFNPEVFIAYYDAQGWIDSNTHMPIDWKIRINLWKAREHNSSGNTKPTKNSFNNIEQHDYDFDALEKILLAN